MAVGSLRAQFSPQLESSVVGCLSVFVIWKTKRLSLEEESFCLEGGVECAREKE